MSGGVPARVVLFVVEGVLPAASTSSSTHANKGWELAAIPMSASHRGPPSRLVPFFLSHWYMKMVEKRSDSLCCCLGGLIPTICSPAQTLTPESDVIVINCLEREYP